MSSGNFISTAYLVYLAVRLGEVRDAIIGPGFVPSPVTPFVPPQKPVSFRDMSVYHEHNRVINDIILIAISKLGLDGYNAIE